MAAAVIFKIEDGVLGLTLVDKAAVGYLDTWQAPGGAEVYDVTIADYEATGVAFQCQTTSSALTASPNTTDDTTPATMCSAEITTTVVGVTSYTLDVTVLQDPNISDGISAYLFEHDTKDAYFYLGLGGDNVPPAAIGRVTVSAGAIGGEARTTLTADVSLQVKVKPDLWVGDATTNRVIKGDGTTVVVPPLLAAASSSTSSSKTAKATADAS
jgi:hypothetical protein